MLSFIAELKETPYLASPYRTGNVLSEHDTKGAAEKEAEKICLEKFSRTDFKSHRSWALSMDEIPRNSNISETNLITSGSGEPIKILTPEEKIRQIAGIWLEANLPRLAKECEIWNHKQYLDQRQTLVIFSFLSDNDAVQRCIEITHDGKVARQLMTEIMKGLYKPDQAQAV